MAYGFFSGFSGIVIDPENLVQNTRQAERLVRQIELSARLIDKQAQMARSWDFSDRRGVLRAMRGVEAILDDAGRYGRSNPGPVFEAEFPRDFEGVTREAMDERREGWQRGRREAMAENRRLQNEVVREMPRTATRLERLVTHSNRADGGTASAQAHTELAAALSAELAKLQALRIARAEAEAQRQAIVQSEAAYADARRDWLMRDWTTPPPPPEGSRPRNAITPFND